jgi:hypothetical protein
MINKRASAGHLPRPIGAAWNRSSAWSCEVTARLTTATNMAIQNVIEAFNSTFDVASFTDEQRAEAYRLLINGVTDGMAEFEKRLRSKHVEVEKCFQSK